MAVARIYCTVHSIIMHFLWLNCYLSIRWQYRFFFSSITEVTDPVVNYIKWGQENPVQEILIWLRGWSFVSLNGSHKSAGAHDETDILILASKTSTIMFIYTLMTLMALWIHLGEINSCTHILPSSKLI